MDFGDSLGCGRLAVGQPGIGGDRHGSTQRRQHLFVGTGVIEAGSKTLIGSAANGRACPGWCAGANAILSLRCCQLNARFED